MALNLSNIIVSKTGTTQKQFFTYTFAQMYLYTSQKTSKRLSDWQILKVPFDSRGIDLYMTQPTILATSFFTVLNFISLTFLSTLFMISSSIDYLHTYKRLELSSLPLYSNFMLIKFYITTVNRITIHTLLMLSLSLHIYILVKFYNSYSFIVIVQPNSPSDHEISQFRL